MLLIFIGCTNIILEKNALSIRILFNNGSQNLQKAYLQRHWSYAHFSLRAGCSFSAFVYLALKTKETEAPSEQRILMRKRKEQDKKNKRNTKVTCLFGCLLKTIRKNNGEEEGNEQIILSLGFSSYMKFFLNFSLTRYFPQQATIKIILLTISFCFLMKILLAQFIDVNVLGFGELHPRIAQIYDASFIGSFSLQLNLCQRQST